MGICAMAAASYFQVSRQLEELHVARLRQQSRVVGMSILERLMFLKSEMGEVAEKYPPEAALDAQVSVISMDAHSRRFISLT